MGFDHAVAVNKQASKQANKQASSSFSLLRFRSRLVVQAAGPCILATTPTAKKKKKKKEEKEAKAKTQEQE